QELTMESLEALRVDGFYYCPIFAAPRDGLASATRFAERLGKLSRGTMRTNPSLTADPSNPFDRPEALGWHNDFTTHATRPRYSLSFIEQQDPQGRPWGDWRVARVPDILNRLEQSTEGRAARALLSKGAYPFAFDGSVVHF